MNKWHFPHTAVHLLAERCALSSVFLFIQWLLTAFKWCEIRMWLCRGFFASRIKLCRAPDPEPEKKKKVPFCRADVPDVEPILKSAHPFLKASPCTKSHTWSWLLIFLFLATNPVPPGGKAWQRVKRLWWLIFAAASNQNRKLCCTFPDHALQNCVFSK